MALAAEQNAPEARTAESRFPVALEYAVAGDLRYLSHHDELRMLARALARAGWPVAHSQGFNPLPKLRVPLPRSVGVAAESAWALVELREPRAPDALHASLADALPAGLELRVVVAPAPRGTPHPQRVQFALALRADEVEGVGRRAAEIVAAPALGVVRREGRGSGRRIDIRPYIDSITLDEGELRFTLRFEQQRTARPVELLSELGLSAEDGLPRLRRTTIQWDMELPGPTCGPAATERNTRG